MTDGPGSQTQSDSRRTANKLTERPGPSNDRVSPADEELEPGPRGTHRQLPTYGVGGEGGG